MSSPTPSSSAPGSAVPNSPGPNLPTPTSAAASSAAAEGDEPGGAAAAPPTLSPLSPDAAIELEPLSNRAQDEAGAANNPPSSASSSSAAGKGNPVAKKRKPGRLAVWLVSFLVFGLVASVFAIVYLVTSGVRGTEFDAVNWTTRGFYFSRDPFTETQLTHIKHSFAGYFTVDAAIAPYIKGGAARPSVPRWDLVTIYRGMSPGQGAAHILLEYLEKSNAQGNNYWGEWTTEHPKAAPLLWDAVRDAVHLEHYERLPEIFDRVRIDDDPKALKSALAKIMLELAIDDARAHAKAGEQAAARRAALVGLSYGESAELRALAGEADQAN